MEFFETTVEITVKRLEKLIEAEVKLDIIKRALEKDGFVVASDLEKILGTEVLKDAEREIDANSNRD